MGVIDWCYPEFKVFTTRYVSYINSCTTVYIIFLITVSVAIRYVPFTCTHLLMLACHFNVYWRYNTSKQLCAQFAALCCCLIHFVAFFCLYPSRILLALRQSCNCQNAWEESKSDVYKTIWLYEPGEFTKICCDHEVSAYGVTWLVYH